jgi:hypothetical protein
MAFAIPFLFWSRQSREKSRSTAGAAWGKMPEHAMRAP